MTSQISKTVHLIEEKLKTVYDPEFPMIDIYTLWLIYDVKFLPKEKKVHILMTFTTPFCPMADMLQEMIKNAVLEVVPDATVDLEITFEPTWTQAMIKDPDLQRMFM
ncbi:MAG: fes assembly suf system protein [uncultured bacterium (gcode 4)]|uniref:Fes assembly suf system protein n=1 Tax=uncultured bacterium (gcode 4) TaxID=1234023 RepID=K1XIX5_9BACT|nr:MAG: fes assembly suf system protein [uncultured bacterium (gcode 4)]